MGKQLFYGLFIFPPGSVFPAAGSQIRAKNLLCFPSGAVPHPFVIHSSSGIRYQKRQTERRFFPHHGSQAGCLWAIRFSGERQALFLSVPSPSGFPGSRGTCCQCFFFSLSAPRPSQRRGKRESSAHSSVAVMEGTTAQKSQAKTEIRIRGSVISRARVFVSLVHTASTAAGAS